MTSQSNALLDTVRKIVRQELQRHQGSTLATVVDQHAAEYACTVQLRDTEIVLQKVPVATSRMGLACIPALGDLVLLQFIAGDINQPIICGSLYNDEDTPPDNSAGQWVCQLPLGGDAVQVVANSEGTASLQLSIGSALTLTLQDDDPVVNIAVGSGSAALTIDSDGSVSISSGNTFTIEAGADLVLKGANITLEGSGEVTVKGAVINLN
jgi:phage baseplate assembly protein gpV